ncbi:hypothetical protein HDV05_003705 [Chytridiales sp. JEL 0842]|nr:hypothetical protein HDV05_003705 [Chytridiales sp. JEL 0842]
MATTKPSAVHPETARATSTNNIPGSINDPSIPPIEWSKASSIYLLNLAGDKVRLKDIYSGKRTLIVFLRRFYCATCVSNIVLFSHLKPILNRTDTRVVFITCQRDLTEVNAFLHSFAFWLRSLQVKNGLLDGSSALPGELYLDPERKAYQFFGITKRVLQGQLYTYIFHYILDDLRYGHIGKKDRPRMKGTDRKTTWRDARHYLGSEFWSRVKSDLLTPEFSQQPGIVVVEDEKLLYRFASRDQENSAPKPTDKDFASALKCDLEDTRLTEHIVQEGMKEFMDMVSNRDQTARVNSSDPQLVQEEKLGHGRESEVYKGKWMGVAVAIKYFKAGVTDAETGESTGDMLGAFANEAALLMSMRHPNVISFMGFGSKPPSHFVVMEYMPRGSLFEILPNKAIQLNSDRRKSMLMDCAQGMKFLHGCKVIHTDLKSLNLLISENWTLKIGDFGIAKELKDVNRKRMPEDESEEAAMLEEQQVKGGTLQWMAPEVMNGDYKPTTKMDVFAFAVIMWEMAMRVKPWKGASARQIMHKVVNGDRLEVMEMKWDKNFIRLMEQCWDSNPDLRPEFSTIVKRLAKVTVPA